MNSSIDFSFFPLSAWTLLVNNIVCVVFKYNVDLEKYIKWAT